VANLAVRVTPRGGAMYGEPWLCANCGHEVPPNSMHALEDCIAALGARVTALEGKEPLKPQEAR
jgi:hypothetical protein